MILDAQSIRTETQTLPIPIPAQDPFDPIDLPRLQRALANAPIGHTVEYVYTLPSTMPAAAAAMADPAARSGLIVVAELQSAGRGRHGRDWIAPPGCGLLVSVGLKPPHLHLLPSRLPMAAGLAACDAVLATAPSLYGQISLKWPNDLMLGPAPEQAGKLGGVLIQTALTPPGELAQAIVGIGINVNQSVEHLPAVAPPAPQPISLRMALGARCDRTALLIALCHALANALDMAPQPLLEAWRGRLGMLGRRVALYAHGSGSQPTLTGRAVDVDDQGALLIQDDQGHIHAVHAGDVSLRFAV